VKKIIAVLLLFSVLFGIVSCTNLKRGKDPEKKYKNIIETYTDMLDAKNNGGALAAPVASANEIEKALHKIVSNCTDDSVMGYATKDINGDGDEELVLMNKSNKLYALFTIKDKTPVLLLTMDDMTGAISPDGTIYVNKYVPEKEEFTYIKRIVDGKLEGLEYGSTVNGEITTYYMIENGTRTEITKSEKFQLDEMLKTTMISPWYITKTVGFRFVPVQNSTSQSTAPTPDFESYEGILSAYKTIVRSFSEYKQLDWINGKFDELFNITDNRTYDVFHQIFFGGIRTTTTKTLFGQDYAEEGNNAYGYAKKDLNGDGIEELILLNDRYEIIAVFTQNKGKAILLNNLYGVWIDENGILRKETYTGGQYSGNTEAFVYEIDGTELKTVIGVGFRLNVVLMQEEWYTIDGKVRTPISKEDGNKLYDDYDVLAPYYSDEEYTRTFSGIEFVPLFETTLATEKHIDTFSTIHRFEEKITVSAISDTDAAISIRFTHTDRKDSTDISAEPEVHITEIEAKAVRNGDKYYFEADGIKGYVNFAVRAVWVTVTESNNEHVACRSYLYDNPEKNSF